MQLLFWILLKRFHTSIFPLSTIPRNIPVKYLYRADDSSNIFYCLIFFAGYSSNNSYQLLEGDVKSNKTQGSQNWSLIWTNNTCNLFVQSTGSQGPASLFTFAPGPALHSICSKVFLMKSPSADKATSSSFLLSWQKWQFPGYSFSSLFTSTPRKRKLRRFFLFWINYKLDARLPQGYFAPSNFVKDAF